MVLVQLLVSEVWHALVRVDGNKHGPNVGVDKVIHKSLAQVLANGLLAEWCVQAMNFVVGVVVVVKEKITTATNLIFGISTMSSTPLTFFFVLLCQCGGCRKP